MCWVSHFDGGSVGESAWAISYNTGKIRVSIYTSSLFNIDFAFTPISNIWYTVVAERSGDYLHCYVNGVEIGTAQDISGTPIRDADSLLRIGQYKYNGTPYGEFKGFVRNLHITNNGTVVLDAPLTSDLTDSSASAHTLTAQGNAAVKSGLILDGTGDYIYFTQTDDFRWGTGAWSWQARVTFDTLSGVRPILSSIGEDPGVYFFDAYWNGSAVAVRQHTGSKTYTWTPTIGVEYLLEWSWDGASTDVFSVDGDVKSSSGSWGGAWDCYQGFRIGGSYNASNFLQGTIRDVVIVKNGVTVFNAPLTETAFDESSPAVDDDPIGGWLDKSGFFNNFSQQTVDYRPLYQTAVLNSNSVARFDGSNDRLDLGRLLLDSGNYTIILVGTLSDTDSYMLALGSTSTGTYTALRWQTGTTVGFVAGSGITGAAKSNGGSYITTLKYDGGSVTHYRDGAGDGTLSQAESYTGDQSTLGSSPNGGVYLTGDIAEVIIYNSALGDTDREAVENYLTEKYFPVSSSSSSNSISLSSSSSSSSSNSQSNSFSSSNSASFSMSSSSSATT